MKKSHRKNNPDVKEIHGYVDKRLIKKLNHKRKNESNGVYFEKKLYEIYFYESEEKRQEREKRKEDLLFIKSEYEKINERLKKLSEEEYLLELDDSIFYAEKLFEEYKKKYPIENYSKNFVEGTYNIKAYISKELFEKIDEVCKKQEITVSHFLISCIHEIKISGAEKLLLKNLLDEMAKEISLFLKRLNFYKREKKRQHNMEQIMNLKLEIKKYRKFIL